MSFADRVLICVECEGEFVFSAAEQAYFKEKQYRNDPKHCKQCKAKRKVGSKPVRFETKVKCSECGVETTVPFRPTRGKPVYCRDCFRKKQETA